jgi:hypothetical protein
VNNIANGNDDETQSVHYDEDNVDQKLGNCSSHQLSTKPY